MELPAAAVRRATAAELGADRSRHRPEPRRRAAAGAPCSTSALSSATESFIAAVCPSSHASCSRACAVRLRHQRLSGVGHRDRLERRRLGLAALLEPRQPSQRRGALASARSPRGRRVASPAASCAISLLLAAHHVASLVQPGPRPVELLLRIAQRARTLILSWTAHATSRPRPASAATSRLVRSRRTGVAAWRIDTSGARWGPVGLPDRSRWCQDSMP